MHITFNTCKMHGSVIYLNGYFSMFNQVSGTWGCVRGKHIRGTCGDNPNFRGVMEKVTIPSIGDPISKIIKKYKIKK